MWKKRQNCRKIDKNHSDVVKKFGYLSKKAYLCAPNCDVREAHAHIRKDASA